MTYHRENQMDNNEIGNEFGTHQNHKKWRQNFIWNNSAEEETCENCTYMEGSHKHCSLKSHTTV